MVEAWLASPLMGRWWMSTLILCGDGGAATAPRNGVSVPNVHKVLEALRSDGLRHLCIDRCTMGEDALLRLSGVLFLFPLLRRLLNLAQTDLATLNLTRVTSEGALSALPPFHLVDLALRDSRLSPSFYQSVFSASSNSLTTLDLESFLGSNPVSSLLPAFHFIAPTLRTLHISDTWAPLFPQLNLCTSLRHLRLYFGILATDVQAILRVLPTSLLTLSVQALDEWAVPVLLRRKVMRVIVKHLERMALKDLRLLVVGRSQKEEAWFLDDDEEGAEIRATLERRLTIVRSYTVSAAKQSVRRRELNVVLDLQQSISENAAVFRLAGEMVEELVRAEAEGTLGKLALRLCGWRVLTSLRADETKRRWALWAGRDLDL